MIKRILLAATATVGVVVFTCGAAVTQPASSVAFITSSLTDSNSVHDIWVTDNGFAPNPPIGSVGYPDGSNYWAQLYAAPGAFQPESALLPVGQPVNFQSLVEAGYVQEDGQRTDLGGLVSTTVGITNTLPGGPVTVQIRAWWGGPSAVDLLSYEAAAASHIPFDRYGKSGLMTISPTGAPFANPPTVPAPLVDVNTGYSDQLAFELDYQPDCDTVTIDQGSLPDGTVGVAYSQTVTASGSSYPPYTFTVISGSLPPGLTLDTSGLLHGTPNAPSSASFTIQATDSNGNGCSGNSPFSINTTCPTVTITPPSLPGATTGVPYSQTLAGNGGTAPYTFATNSGSLPPGLAMSSSGHILGTPTASGSYSFSVVATDFYGCQSSSQPYTINNNCPLITVSPATVPGGSVGTAYAPATYSASGGTGPYGFTISSGGLPPGLSLSAGVISGVPTTACSSNFTITATDANTCIGVSNYSITIVCPAITVNPSTLPTPTLGSNYSTTVTATGSATNYTFSVSSGALPPGLSLAGTTTNAVISGTPSAAGTASFTIKATDAYGCSGTRNYSLTPGCPTITLSPISLPNGQLTSNYNQTITASGAAGSFTFGVTSGALPPGITLSSGGLLSGIPTSSTTFAFTVTATNSDGGCTGNYSYVLVINSSFSTAAVQYYGLFQNTNGPQSRHTDGFFQIAKVLNKETFTGKLVLDGQVVNLVGSFDTNGMGTVATMLVSRLSPKPPLLLTMQANLANDTISGVISNAAEGWYSVMTGDRYVFSAGNPASELQGGYTMVLPGNPGSASLPGGAGGARITIQANGMALVQLAYTGDGQAWTPWSAPVSKNGDLPLFTQLYGLQGVLMGWLNFTPTASPPAATFGGDLHWEKPNGLGGLYPLGFSNNVALVGSAYIPSAGSDGHGIFIVDGTVTATGGNLLAPISNTCTIIVGIASMNPPVLDAMKLTYASSFDVLGVTFLHPLHPSPLTTGHGWYLQTQNYGDGWFKAPSASQTGDFQLH